MKNYLKILFLMCTANGYLIYSMEAPEQKGILPLKYQIILRAINNPEISNTDEFQNYIKQTALAKAYNLLKDPEEFGIRFYQFEQLSKKLSLLDEKKFLVLIDLLEAIKNKISFANLPDIIKKQEEIDSEAAVNYYKKNLTRDVINKLTGSNFPGKEVDWNLFILHASSVDPIFDEILINLTEPIKK